MLAEALVELASETPTADARSLIQHPGQERGRLGSRDREAGGRRGPSSNVVFPELALTGCVGLSVDTSVVGG